MKKTVKEKISTITSVLLIISTVICLIVVFQSVVSKEVSFFGYRFFYITTGSMEPTIPVGSLIIVDTNARDFKEGDVITFLSNDSQIYNMPNTHRIVEIKEESSVKQFYTKGDANNTPDYSYITEKEIIGKMVFQTGSIVIIGKFLEMLSNRWIFGLIILIPIVFVTVSSVKDFTREYKLKLMETAKKQINDEEISNKEGEEK